MSKTKIALILKINSQIHTLRQATYFTLYLNKRGLPTVVKSPREYVLITISLRKNLHLSVHQDQFLGRSKVTRFQGVVHHPASP